MHRQGGFECARKALLTALFLSLATPTVALADPAPRATTMEVSHDVAPVTATADENYAQREVQSKNLETFEGGDYYYHEHRRYGYGGVMVLTTALLAALLVVVLLA